LQNGVNIIGNERTVNAPPNKEDIMAKKSWNELSTDEKLEALREDIAKAYDVLNRLIDDVGNTHRRVNQIEPKLIEVSKAIEALQRRLPKMAA
jgi:hypothetical protein